MAHADSFDRFVTAVHRRAVVIGVVERIGLCLATAAGIACVLMFVADWRGVPAGPIGVIAVAASIVIGTTWGIVSRPTRLAAVMSADRQLNLADLLSSALMSSQDDFGQAVRAMANRICQTRSPSEVILNRLGVRAWGGIGLAWAMVLVLSLLAGNALNTRASEMAGSSTTPARPETGARTSVASGQPTVGGHEAASESFSQLGSPQDSQTSTAAAKSANGQAAGPANSGGEQATKSNATLADHLASPRGSEQPGPANPNANAVAGSGVSSPANRGQGLVGDQSTGSTTNHAAAPWSSDHWPADRAAAMQAVQSGTVPDSYRDLVRDYFNSAK